MPTAVSPTFGARLAASVAHLLARSSFPPPPRGEGSGVGGSYPTGAHAPVESKASRAGPLIAFEHLRQPVWTPRDYAAFANEGFMQNAIVYRCVRMIAECVATVPLLLYDGDQEIEDHPLKDLLRRPNGHETYPDLIQRLVGFLLVSGNAYIEAVAIDGEVREIHVLRPDRMKLVPGPDGWPEAFEYTVAGRTVRISGEVTEGVRSILHLKLFHPSNDHYGLSPLEAAASAIDLHNTAARWNKSLLDNSARPSGAIVYTSREGNLTSEQIERLKSELEAGFQGSSNAGRPLLLEGGLDWKAMSLSPKDMDFLDARHAAAREIALALGVPPMLLGIPGDNTYSNLAEAQRTFWRSTVLPLAERIASGLSNWLTPAYAPDALWASEGASKRSLRLVPDLDNLPALAIEREALWASLEKTSFLTSDEKRALAGFSPLPPDQKFNPNHDALGRFTTGDGGGGFVHPAQAKRPQSGDRFGGKPPPPGDNNPPKPLPPVLPPAGSDQDSTRLFDENGQAAPRGFSSIDELNAFRERLSQELPGDVTAVMQGSSVERGGARFRNTAQGDQQASDFDVSLTGGNLFDLAALRLPRMVKGDRVGPFNEDQLLDASIDLRGISKAVGRDTKFMIYRNQIELYRRGPGYPLVTR